MNIEIVKEIGHSFLKFFSSENSSWEFDFENRLKGLNYEQIKSILTWVKAEITWSKSKVWKASDRDTRILELIDNALYEAENCKKNLATRLKGRK